MTAVLAASLTLLLTAVAAIAADDPLPWVPDGFTIEKVAASPLVKHPLMAGFDDRGRLFVAEAAGKNLRADDLLKELPNFVRMLEDTDGDGVFDKSTIFADKMTLPMGALWYRGALYVAAPPSIWKLEDTNDDGVADKRTELVDKFGFSGNAASVHGCILGPCGRIYWCDGRHGFEFADGRKGKASGIFSCRPDGSDVQVFAAGGMDNPVEVDFLPTGEMFGTANIMLNPRGDTLVHWIDGGAYPRHDQGNVTAELKKTGGLLPPMTNLGHVAVSGMMRYRSDQFGSQFKNNIFISVFNTHKIIRSVLERSGSTFQSRQEDFMVSENADFHPTDVLEDADGSLLVIDTGGWFRIGCPTSQVAKPQIHGAIYRIRRKGAHQIDDPRGLKKHLDKQSPAALVKLLNDSRPVVRNRAVDLLALAEQAAVPALASALRSGDETTRRNAVWAASRMSMAAIGDVLRTGLMDDAESVKLAAARSIGVRGSADSVSLGILAQLAISGSAPLKREAATALGRVGIKGRALNDDDARTVLKSLFGGIRSGVTDRYMEHALIYAIIRIDDTAGTAAFLRDASPQVRRAALIALEQMDGGNLTRNQVIPLLDTDDPALQQEALRIIGSHDGWATETLSLLRGWLQENKLSPERETVLRGFLLAQSKDRSIQRLIADAFNRPGAPVALRLLLLDVIYRAPVTELSDIVVAALQRAIVLGSPEVRLQAIRVIHDRGLESFDRQLRRMAGEQQQLVDVRVEALSTIASRIDALSRTEFTFLLSRLDENVEPLSRLAAAQALAGAPLDDNQLVQLSGTFVTAGPLAIPVLVRAFRRAKSERVGFALVLALKTSEASANVSAVELAKLLSAYPSNVQTVGKEVLKKLGVNLKEQKARLAELAPLEAGGDAERGRQIFFGKKAACANCHTVAALGGKVGPDLSAIGKIRSGGDLIEAIAFPSSSFARGFRSYTILTEQGKVHTGIISRQSADTLYLRTAELAEIRIARTSIEDMRESNTSVMPKGLDKTLSADELRDLIAYLRSRK
jgi:putative membrane-bound dehydrogenase-like protein